MSRGHQADIRISNRIIRHSAAGHECETWTLELVSTVRVYHLSIQWNIEAEDVEPHHMREDWMGDEEREASKAVVELKLGSHVKKTSSV